MDYGWDRGWITGGTVVDYGWDRGWITGGLQPSVTFTMIGNSCPG